MDGAPLEGWFIPADSDRLIIHNHFLPGNGYGYPGHLPEFGGLGGFEVNFLHEYKALHDAGYNVLAYDMRNHGMSGQQRWHRHATARSPRSPPKPISRPRQIDRPQHAGSRRRWRRGAEGRLHGE